ncbi:MAG: hypothetical protein B1H08_01515 [Candidatus Omnitrophica bacterium 4484_171]|nr:MAG: hypothetical protein B1H08_01515 [Candidatus Omnitrophica bacterium 4484_171]
MKKVVCLAFGIFFLMSVSAYSKDSKIGYADVFKIFNGYVKTKDYEKSLEEKKKSKESENKLEEKKNTIVKMQDKLDLLKSKEKEEQKAKIKKAITEYRNIESKIYTDLKKESDAKMKEIISDINDAVKNYAIKNDFDLIINKSATVYGKDEMDITNNVLNKLNGEYKKK